MKILWVSHILPYPETGYGALQRSRNLLLELTKSNEVHLVALENGFDILQFDLNQAKLNLEQYCKTVKLVRYNKKIKQITALLKSTILNKSYSECLYSSYLLKREVYSIIKKENIDLVHIDTLGLFDDFSEKFNVRAVLNHHNFESKMMKDRAEKERNYLKKFFYLREWERLKTLEQKICNRFTAHIFVSKNDQKEFNQTISQVNSVVVENPVDTELFKFRESIPKNKNIIFIGGLDWYPNYTAIKYFIENIFPELYRLDKETKFVIVGRKADPLIEYPNVIYTGFVNDLSHYLNQARVFVCPMLEGGGTRLKIIDALSSGIPVVSTTLGAEGIEYINKKDLIIADNSESFIRSILNIFSDDELVSKLSQNGRQLVEQNYSKKVLGRKLNSFYISLK